MQTGITKIAVDLNRDTMQALEMMQGLGLLSTYRHKRRM